MNKHAHHATCGCHDDKQDAQPTGGCLELLRQVVVRAAHFLPTQGPIGGFVHHNTLHSLQHKVFEDAVVEGAQLFDAEPFLSEVAYQSERRRQRILDDDIDAFLNREPDEEILPGRLTRRQLRRVMLTPGVRRVNGVNVSWQLDEGDWLRSFRSDLPAITRNSLRKDNPQALWDACLARVNPQPAPVASRPKRPRDAVLAQFGIDMDLLIHPSLIRLVGAYLDQGIAYWPMPLREQGLLKAPRARSCRRHQPSSPHISLAYMLPSFGRNPAVWMPKRLSWKRSINSPCLPINGRSSLPGSCSHCVAGPA